MVQRHCLILFSSWPPFTHICSHSCNTRTGTHLHIHVHTSTHLHMHACTCGVDCLVCFWLRTDGMSQNALNNHYVPKAWLSVSYLQFRSILITALWSCSSIIHYTITGPPKRGFCNRYIQCSGYAPTRICSPSSPKASITFLDSSSKWP